MNVPKAVIAAAKKELGRMVRKADRLHWLMTGNPYRADNRKDMEMLIKYQSQKGKTVELIEDWSALMLEIGKVRKWVAREEWKSNAKVDKIP